MDKKPITRPLFSLDDSEIEFLRDEGLDMLALFRRIRDPQKRELVLDLMRTIADDQTETDGSS